MKRLSLVLALAFIGVISYAQRTVVGTVTDQKGEGLIGASVLVKGSTAGTVTDISGNFSLKVPEGMKTLVISYTGYNTYEMELTASNVVNVVLQEGVTLETAVVTALGISKSEKAVGYAVQSVQSAELLKAGETNFVQSLSSKVAGLQVTGSTGAAGGSSFFTIRGINTISGNNQPLIVVDGVPIDNQQLRSGSGGEVASVAFSNRAIDINQNEIESVSVLKGAAATALYGSQAGNGAIIITTKRAKAGAQKISVDFSTSLTLSQINKTTPLQREYAQGLGAYSGPETNTSYSYGPSVDTLRYANSDYVLSASQDRNNDGIYDWDKNGPIVGQSSPFASNRPVQTYDHYDFFQTGIATNNNLAISAANATSNIRFSVGFNNEEGVIPNNTFQRINFGLNAGTKLGSKVDLGIGVQYINSGGNRIEQGSNTSGVMLGLVRTAPTFDNANGLDNPVDDPSSYSFPNGSPRAYRGISSASGTSIYDNPYWTVNNNPLVDDVNRFIGNFNLTYNPTSWLNLTWRPGIDFYSDFRKQYFAISSSTLPAGQVFEDQYFSKNLNSDLIATVKKSLTEDIGMSFSLGHNIRENALDRVYVEGNGLVIPGFYDLSNASSVISYAENTLRRNTGYFSVLDLNYQSWLYLTGTARVEKDLSLPEDSNNYLYYSASSSIVLTDLLGMTNNEAFSFGKIRGSFGRVGLGTFPYSTDTYFESGTYADGWTNGLRFPFSGQSGFTFGNQLGNPNIKPEFRDSWEVGADLRFLKNRIGLDFTYYNSVSKDIILSVPVTGSSGHTSFVQNSAELENKGIEAILTLRPVEKRDFSWDMMFNFTRNRNNVNKLADGVDQVFLGGFTGASTRAVVGVPYGSIFGFGFYRDANGNRVIDGRQTLSNGDANPGFGFPVLDPNERAFNSALPDYTLGIRNTITYKGFSLSALLDIKQGGYVWNGTKGALFFFGTHQETADRRNTMEVFEGNVAVYNAEGELDLYDHDSNAGTPDIPRTTGANAASVLVDENWLAFGNGNSFFGDNTEDFVEDASWVRLRDVSLAYAMPKRFLDNSKISYVNVSVTGRNLWLRTPFTGIDPETNLYGAANAQGLEYFNMPNTKSVMISLQVGF